MSELVASVSLHFFAGTDIELEFTVTDAVGDPVNIAGMDIAFVVRRDTASEAALSTEGSSPTATATITSSSGGVFRVTAGAEDTESLIGTYRFQAQIMDGQGNKSTVSRGFITFAGSLIS